MAWPSLQVSRTLSSSLTSTKHKKVQCQIDQTKTLLCLQNTLYFLTCRWKNFLTCRLPRMAHVYILERTPAKEPFKPNSFLSLERSFLEWATRSFCNVLFFGCTSPICIHRIQMQPRMLKSFITKRL